MGFRRKTKAYYTAPQRKVSLTALQRCCFVCSAKQQLADSCGGETLGQKVVHHTDSQGCGWFNAFRNQPEIRKRLVETSALPPPGGPKAPKCGGVSCTCSMGQMPKRCAQSTWKRYFNMCKPQSLGRATCVKRTDVDKKAHLLSACRGRKRQEELFIYSHVMVKATGCRVQGKNQQCRGDLAKIASTKACYGPNVSGNGNGPEPKKKWCKFVDNKRGRGGTVSRSFSGMRVFRAFRRGPAEKKAKEKNAKKKKKEKTENEKKEKAKNRKRDACVKKLQDDPKAASFQVSQDVMLSSNIVAGLSDLLV